VRADDLEFCVKVDYLRDARPEPIARLLACVSLPEVRALLVSSAAGFAFIGMAWAIGEVHTHGARVELSALQLRVARSSVAAARVKREIRSVEREQAFARLLLHSRGSGARAALLLSRIGNTLPGTAWLTQLTVDERGAVLEGRAGSLSAVGSVLRAFSPADLDGVRRANDGGAILSYRFRYGNGALR
jgi:hypothetical protein